MFGRAFPCVERLVRGKSRFSTESAVSPIRYPVMTSADNHASDLQQATFAGLPCVSDIPACAWPSSSPSFCYPAGLWSSRRKQEAPAAAAGSPPPALQASVAVPVWPRAWRIPAETQVVWLVGLMAAAVRLQPSCLVSS
jgi:hypothetical protein